jgi:hypothetical protein
MVQSAKWRGIVRGSWDARHVFNRVFHRNCEYVDQLLRDRALTRLALTVKGAKYRTQPEHTKTNTLVIE